MDTINRYKRAAKQGKSFGYLVVKEHFYDRNKFACIKGGNVCFLKFYWRVDTNVTMHKKCERTLLNFHE